MLFNGQRIKITKTNKNAKAKQEKMFAVNEGRNMKV